MATKQIEINGVLTPGLNVAAAEAMLGKVVEPPKTRWTPGQLAGQAVNLTSAPVILLVTATALRVVGFGSEAQGVAAMEAVASALDNGAIPFLDGSAVDPGNGSLRSRVVDLFGFGYSDPSITDFASIPAALQGVASALVIPSRPTFTASSLVAKVDSFFQDRDVPADYCLLLSQFNGRLLVSGGAGVDVATSALEGAAGYAVVAAFDLSIPDGAVVTPETGPIFG